MGEKMQQYNQQPNVDFGDEVPYAFGYLPENKRRNDEMFARAVERAAQKKNPHPLPKE